MNIYIHFLFRQIRSLANPPTQGSGIAVPMSAALNGITLNNFMKCVKVCEKQNKTNPGIVVARRLFSSRS